MVVLLGLFFTGGVSRPSCLLVVLLSLRALEPVLYYDRPLTGGAPKPVFTGGSPRPVLTGVAPKPVWRCSCRPDL
ncbi:hypothetical protein AVEN_141159-1 [Araneus ventricosus]|uniref:Uncharacterized protein n=1 Tax=Araneus ventricosus TaxID=182803 RepID=A0A4Y2KN09_ARAVE|nr:hypothetical protein AVEN_141159-1 [Araneus ventricosus]